METLTSQNEIGVPYEMGYARSTAVADDVRQDWFAGASSEPWSLTLPAFSWETAFTLLGFFEEGSHISEIDFGSLEMLTVDTESAYSVADYSDAIVSEMIDIEAQAAKFSREIAKTKIQNIIVLLGRDHSYHALDDTVFVVRRSPSKAEWALELEKLGPKRPSTQELAGLIRSLNSVLRAGDFWQIDNAFRTLNVTKISVEGLIALLRTTYYRRSSLETWTAFLESVRKELNSRGLNTQEVLFGLL
jgi:hypothetical protein